MTKLAGLLELRSGWELSVRMRMPAAEHSCAMARP